MNQQRAVHPLAEGALLAALIAVLGVVSLGGTPLRYITGFLWGIPLIFMIIKYDLRTGIIALLISLTIMLSLFTPVTVFLFTLEMAPLAICYGILAKNKVTAGKTLIIGAVVAVVAEVLTILGFLYLAGVNIFPVPEEIQHQVNEALILYEKAGLIDIYTENGLSEETIKYMISQSVELMALLIPAALVLSAIIRAFLTWVFSQRILKGLGYKINSLPKFKNWSLPWYSIWFLIVGLIIMMTGDQFAVSQLAMIGKNMVAVTIFIYMIIGVGISTNLLMKWKFSSWLKALIIIIGIMNFSGTIVLFIFLGIFDPFLNFRRLGKAQN